MSTVVICGGGFGGVATAAALRRLLPDGSEIVLIDRRAAFVMGLRKIWAALGTEDIAVGRRPLADIAGVSVMTDEIRRLDPARRRVELAGRVLEGDAIVIALGAELVMEALPGLAEHGINVWHPDEAPRVRQRLAALAAGRVAIGIFGLPYACPPAPFELALLARDMLPPAVEVTVFTPAPIALPVLGPQHSARIEALLAERGVEFQANRRAEAVRAATVDFAGGGTLDFDLLLAVPPHRCPSVLVEAGLARPDDWVRPDPRTLATAHAGVYAIGDCTAIVLANGMAMPKAGALAQAQGEAVAQRIAADFEGRPAEATFDGVGECFIELGRGMAALAGGRFLADPPDIGIGEASAEGLREKREFERSRLAAWFGR